MFFWIEYEVWGNYSVAAGVMRIVSDLCEISDLLLFVGYFATKVKE